MGAWLLFLILIALGFAAIRALWPAPPSWSSADPLRLAAAPAIGFGLGGCLYFALRIVLQQPPAVAIAAVCLAAAGLSWFAWRRAQSAVADVPAVSGQIPFWLWLLFGVGAAMAFFTYLMLSGAAPHGEWDAWSIWNLRARFLVRAQEFVSPFSPVISWSHPDYPLLVPGVIALLWHAGGVESPSMAGAVGFGFLFSTVAVPFFTLRLLRGPALAALGALTILGATSLVRVSASQYADVPLAAYIVIAACFLVYALEVEPVGNSVVFIAGLSAGFAAWTKNEGLLFCVSIVLAHLLSIGGKTELPRRFATLISLLAGIVAVLAFVGHFKFRLAPANDLVNAGTAGVAIARATDFNRYWVTFWAFVGELLTFGSVLVPPVIVFAVWLALVRFRSKVTGAALLPLVAVVIQLAGYFAIYVTTPQDLDWQLNTSLPRLLLHVWPLSVAGIFLISGALFGGRPQPEPARPRSK